MQKERKVGEGSNFKKKRKALKMLDFQGFLSGGGCEIRTHAPVKANGFQDRLVMTTSITLRVQQRLLYHTILILSSIALKRFLFFFKDFLKHKRQMKRGED